MKTKLIISLLAFLAITALASGQNNGVNFTPQNGKGKGMAYVDANNNGICDNYENRTSGTCSGKKTENFRCCGQGQRQGDGQKGLYKGKGHGRNFVDADKNGVCDHNDTSDKK
jgi:hypothetical protein